MQDQSALLFYHIYPLDACGATKANDFKSEPVGRLGDLLTWIPHIKNSPEFAGDNGALVLTRTTVRLFGFTKPEEIVRKQMMFGSDPHTIIGVAEDFYQQLDAPPASRGMFRLK